MQRRIFDVTKQASAARVQRFGLRPNLVATLFEIADEKGWAAPAEIKLTQHGAKVDVRVNEPRRGGIIVAPGERAQRA